MNEISTTTLKKVCEFKKGTIFFLAQIGKSNILPFSDYQEIDEKICFPHLTLAVKIIEAKNLNIINTNSLKIYCVLKIAGIVKKTRAIHGTLDPIWNKIFYFKIPSYSTNELSIQIFNKNKDNNNNELLYDKIFPIKSFKCGIVEENWYDSLHLKTHLIQPDQLSFESYSFSPITKILHIQNLDFKSNVFCLLQLKNDEYWRYTKPGNFSDYFTFEYINNSILCIKTSDLKNTSEEFNIDISSLNEDKIFENSENSFGKFKISVVNEIKPFSVSTFWKCNIFIKEITNIVKEKDVLWNVDINNISSGFTYDGIINKYISININSLQSDDIKLTLYKNEKGSKKEYGKDSFKILGMIFGIVEEKNIYMSDKKISLSIHITPPNYEPFVNNKLNPLIMHIYVIEAMNIPKMDLTSKTDPYVLLKFEKDNIGIKTKALDNTLTPQWNELLDLIITDPKENLIIEIWDKNVIKDKIIKSTKIDIQKYLNGEPHFEWFKIDKILLNLVIQVKYLDEKYISIEEVNSKLNNMTIPSI